MYYVLMEMSDAIGITGVILLLIAYFLLNIGYFGPNHLSYQVLNLFGAAFILFSLFYSWNLSAFIIETIWIAISFFGIAKILYKKNKNH